MKVVRMLDATPGEVFDLLVQHLLDERAAHGGGSDFCPRVGTSWSDGEFGRVVVTEFEPGSVLAWRARTLTDEVASRYELRMIKGGCEVTFSREWLSGGLVGGRFGEAVLLGQMSRSVMDLQAELDGETFMSTPQSVSPARLDANSISMRLLRRLFS